MMGAYRAERVRPAKYRGTAPMSIPQPSIPQPRPPTLEELLEWERQQPDRYEYVGGILRAMVGGSLAHNTIALNIASSLRARLRDGPCRAFMENAKVATAEAFTYPDVVVTCSSIDWRSDVVPEPLLIFEVLSRSTQDYDQGSKWLAYQTIPSLLQFVLVSQDTQFVVTYTRDSAAWRYGTLRGPQAELALASIGARLPLADIYEDSGIAS